MALGRRRNRASFPNKATFGPVTPLWKRPWPWLLGVVAGLALLLGNITSILTNARALPSEVRKTSDQFFGWYKDYDGWRGRWTNNPEGLVDAVELNLGTPINPGVIRPKMIQCA